MAATVDGRTISDAQVKQDAALYSFLASLNRVPCGQAAEDESEEAACNRFTLSNLIQESLVGAYAGEHDLSVKKGDVDETVAQVEQAVGGEKSLKEMLDGEGLVKDDFLGLARRVLIFNEVQKDIAADISEQDLGKAYEEQSDLFTQIHTRHILLDKEKEAEKIADQATTGNFEKLAKKYSTDPSAKDNGGDLGFLPASQLDPEFVEGALALEPGEISRPVQTQFGWHVINLVESDVTSFEDAKEDLRGQLGSEAFGDWLLGRAEGAEIDVNPRYGRWDPETRQVVPVTSTATAPPAETGGPPGAGGPGAPQGP